MSWEERKNDKDTVNQPNQENEDEENDKSENSQELREKELELEGEDEDFEGEFEDFEGTEIVVDEEEKQLQDLLFRVHRLENENAAKRQRIENIRQENHQLRQMNCLLTTFGTVLQQNEMWFQCVQFTSTLMNIGSTNFFPFAPPLDWAHQPLNPLSFPPNMWNEHHQSNLSFPPNVWNEHQLNPLSQSPLPEEPNFSHSSLFSPQEIQVNVATNFVLSSPSDSLSKTIGQEGNDSESPSKNAESQTQSDEPESAHTSRKRKLIDDFKNLSI